MRRFHSFALAALVALAGCGTTEPLSLELVPDPTLTFDTARARWLASRPASYTFEFDAANAMVPSPGFARVTVAGGALVEVRRVESGELLALGHGFTIDQLWERLAAARAAGEAVSELQFSVEGIPIRAMVGTFANDGGVLYRLRAYTGGH